MSPDGPEVAPLSAPLRSMAARWVEAWGAGDARSVWLAAVALVLERRGHLADGRLFERAARLATALVSGPVPETHAPATRDTARDSFTASKDSTGAERLAEGSAPSSAARHAPASPSVAARMSAEPMPPVTTHGQTGATGSVVTPPPATPPAVIPRAPDVEHGAGESGAPSSSEPDTRLLSPWPEIPRPTEAGGLLFLLPILERLGIAALLEEHPSLFELDVPDRLLSLVAERLGIPATDPSRVILDAQVRGQRPAVCPFTLPERLRVQLLSKEDTLRAFRTEGTTERTVLTDASGRLPLAITYGAASEPLPPRVSDTLPPVMHAEDDLGLLLRGLLTALRRWCRRHARMGLHTLVHRPGRITATRTHIDVLFDIQQADLRVRGAGLDVDPGWVPWLGRVVRFHYLYGEE